MVVLADVRDVHISNQTVDEYVDVGGDGVLSRAVVEHVRRHRRRRAG
ncbi:MAG: hypothetical protein R3C68_01970 [Myxococcota bacterium]